MTKTIRNESVSKLPKHLQEERIDIIIYLYNKGYSDGDIRLVLTNPITRQRVQQIRVEGRLQHSRPILKLKDNWKK